jgi:hypothetical protein
MYAGKYKYRGVARPQQREAWSAPTCSIYIRIIDMQGTAIVHNVQKCVCVCVFVDRVVSTHMLPTHSHHT